MASTFEKIKGTVIELPFCNPCIGMAQRMISVTAGRKRRFEVIKKSNLEHYTSSLSLIDVEKQISIIPEFTFIHKQLNKDMVECVFVKSYVNRNICSCLCMSL